MIKYNWARNVKFTPSEVLYPETELAMMHLVEKASDKGKKIRVIGSGHSFTEVCKTDEILVSLDKYQGIISIDKEKCQVRVKAGTKLKTLGRLLHKFGLAMENLGDIDTQSIAGTISTGTHGTGVEFGSISTQVIELKFVNGEGKLIHCNRSKYIEFYKAGQVSLGTLGIISEVTLQCVPSYKLQIQNNKEKLKDVLSTIEQRNVDNRNFEYYWIPHTNTAWTKTTNIVYNGEPYEDTRKSYLSELIIENYTLFALSETARFLPFMNPVVSKITAMSLPTTSKLAYSHNVYSSIRLVKFTEMEYSVPAEAYQDVMKDITQTIKRNRYNVHFPIENRWVKGDDIPLSPAYGRDSAYIACHVYHKKSNKKYFSALEDIFKAYDGRPHWGKMNTVKNKDLQSMYPKFSEFDKVRKQHDPDGIFLNSYLETLFL